MIIKNKFGLYTAIFAVTMIIGLSGHIPSAAAEGWKISNGFTVDNFFGIGQVRGESTTNDEFKAFAVQMMEESTNQNSAVTKVGTEVNLRLSEFNGFEADNFFGIGQAQETSTITAVTKVGTEVNLGLSEFNGFEADNFFGQD